MILVLLSGFTIPQLKTYPNNSYNDLVDLFKEWRAFENPPKLEGAPDYTSATFERRWSEFKSLQAKLVSIDTSNWDVPNRVDWHIVWAEMNGYDFNHNILKPWVRDPAFYKILWMHRSDVPAHEGPTNHATIEIWTYDFPLSNPSKQKLISELKVIPKLYQQARKKSIGSQPTAKLDRRDGWGLELQSARRNRRSDET